MTFDEFKNQLEKASTEEVVKATYASYFKIKYNTSHHHDLYTPQVFSKSLDEGLRLFLECLRLCY